MATLINREASEKTKGFRLQKLRVIELMLDAVAKYHKPLIYASIEYIEDLYLNDRADGIEYLEEDKNYDPETSFTFNSSEVSNTLVSYIDIWFRWENSDNLALGFYSTNCYAKEKATKKTKEIGITLPDKAIIEALVNKEYDHPNLLSSVKKFIIAEYTEQYKDPLHPGHIDLIEKMDDDRWKKFLDCIDWKFGQSNELDKKLEVLGKIKSCKFYNSNLIGKEEIILSLLMEAFDERQNLKDLTEKFVHCADVELAFIKSSSYSKNLENDPVWELWSSIAPSDSRNIKDKIQAVCKDFDNRNIQHLSLKVSRSLLEQQKLTSDKSVLSIKYRIFEHCQAILLQFIKDIKDGSLNENEVNEIIRQLNDEARSCVQSLSAEYRYTYINDKLIDGLILELFDSCFLAFD